MGFSSSEVMQQKKNKKNILWMAVSPWLLLHEIESNKKICSLDKNCIFWEHSVIMKQEMSIHKELDTET